MSLEINQQIAEVLFKIPQILNTPWEKNFDPTASIKFANDNVSELEIYLLYFVIFVIIKYVFD
jgi:hypothetical protein